MDSKQVGNLTELQCITKLDELGYSVSIPYGDSEKYDFIFDDDNWCYCGISFYNILFWI